MDAREARNITIEARSSKQLNNPDAEALEIVLKTIKSAAEAGERYVLISPVPSKSVCNALLGLRYLAFVRASGNNQTPALEVTW